MSCADPLPRLRPFVNPSPRAPRRRAALATQNAGVEAAMEWVLQHMEDPDFADPLPDPSAAAAPAAPAGDGGDAAVDSDKVSMLEAMGFNAEHARAALTVRQPAPLRAARRPGRRRATCSLPHMRAELCAELCVGVTVCGVSM
eukprot:355165-Chlamydomonas_euryale.AAC.3